MQHWHDYYQSSQRGVLNTLEIGLQKIRSYYVDALYPTRVLKKKKKKTVLLTAEATLYPQLQVFLKFPLVVECSCCIDIV